MKILVGVDQVSTADRLSWQVASLAFADARIELAHAVEIISAAEIGRAHAGYNVAISQFLKTQTELANSVLSQGEEAFRSKGFKVRSKILGGLTGNALIRHATDTAADLLVIGSSGKNALERTLVGSVSRKVVVSAPISVLIGKQKESVVKPQTVVLATDHSDYANRCMEKLLSWKPQALARVVVVTVYSEQQLKAMGAAMEHFKSDISSWIKDGLVKSNDALVAKVQGALPNLIVSSRVESGEISEVLESVMKMERADLLVLGAQGKGFLDRLTLGSVSLDQALRCNYSVLVMRV